MVPLPAIFQRPAEDLTAISPYSFTQVGRVATPVPGPDTPNFLLEALPSPALVNGDHIRIVGDFAESPVDTMITDIVGASVTVDTLLPEDTNGAVYKRGALIGNASFGGNGADDAGKFVIFGEDGEIDCASFAPAPVTVVPVDPSIELSCDPSKVIQYFAIELIEDANLEWTSGAEPTPGMQIVIRVSQDGTGGHSLGLPPGSLAAGAGAGAIALTAAANSIDILRSIGGIYWTADLNFT